MKPTARRASAALALCLLAAPVGRAEYIPVGPELQYSVDSVFVPVQQAGTNSGLQISGQSHIALPNAQPGQYYPLAEVTPVYGIPSTDPAYGQSVSFTSAAGGGTAFTLPIQLTDIHTGISGVAYVTGVVYGTLSPHTPVYTGWSVDAQISIIPSASGELPVSLGSFTVRPSPLTYGAGDPSAPGFLGSTFTVQPVDTPEPSTAALALLGLGACGGWWWKRYRAQR